MGEKEEEMQKTAAENVDCHAFKLHDVEEFACLGQNHQQEESISCFLDLASRSILLYLKALHGLHSSRLKILPGLGVFSTQSLTGASHQLGLWPVLALPPLLSSTDSAVQSNFVQLGFRQFIPDFGRTSYFQRLSLRPSHPPPHLLFQMRKCRLALRK